MANSDRECGEPLCKVGRLETDETLDSASTSKPVEITGANDNLQEQKWPSGNKSDTDFYESDEYFYDSEVPEETDELLEVGQDLEEVEGNVQQLQNEEEEKIVLVEKRSNRFEILPEGWICVSHDSGMPFYVHRPSGVCTMSQPYFLGEGSVRKHSIPVSAIPCLQYLRALHDEVSAGEDKIAGTETTANITQASDLLDKSSAIPPPGLMVGNSEIETAVECHQQQCVDPPELWDYCQKRFSFKTLKSSNFFRSWAERRLCMKGNKKANKLLKKKSLAHHSEQLIILRKPDKDGSCPNSYEEQYINLKYKNYLQVLCEFVQIVFKEKHPKYICKTLDKTTHAMTLVINEKHYGTGYGKKKITAKAEAAKASLKILLPELFGKNREQTNDRDEILNRFIVKYDHLQPIENLLIPNSLEDSESSCSNKVFDMKPEGVFDMKPEGKTYRKVLLEFMMYACKTSHTYACNEVDNVITPHKATVLINEKHYGVGYGINKKVAKAEASKATLEILLPELFRKRKETHIIVDDDLFKRCIVKCDNLQPIYTLTSDKINKKPMTKEKRIENLLRITCKLFNSELGCEDGQTCKFKHLCGECLAKHPKFECKYITDNTKNLSKPACKFFNTELGCKNGQTCKFKHVCCECLEKHPKFECKYITDNTKKLPHELTCKFFNNEMGCTNVHTCRYLHKCRKCLEKHPIYECIYITDNETKPPRRSINEGSSAQDRSRDPSFSRLSSRPGDRHDSNKRSSSHQSGSPHYSSRDDRSRSGGRHDSYKHSSSHRSGSPHYSSRDDSYKFRSGDHHDSYKHSSSHRSGSPRYSNRDDGYKEDRYSSKQCNSHSPSYSRDRKRSRYDDNRRSHSRSPMSPRRRHHDSLENPLSDKCLGNIGPSLYTTKRQQVDNEDGVCKLGEAAKQVPDNAASMHPGMLLHSMKPSVQYNINQITQDNQPHFMVSVNIDGATFTGAGPSVKKAKLDLAREAIRILYGVESTFELSS